MLFLLIASMMLVVLIRDRILLDSQHPVWKHYEPFKWWLLPHGITAALTLLLGPLQFSSRLRRRHLNWHRLFRAALRRRGCDGRALGIVIETIKYRIGMVPLRTLIGASDSARYSWLRRGRVSYWQDAAGSRSINDGCAQLLGCHGIRGGSLRRFYPVAGAVNGRAQQLP
jgi:hypothetical protein